MEHYKLEKETAITIGNFDGVHLGHRALIQTVIEQGEKQNLLPSVLTFRPHPAFMFLNLDPKDAPEGSSHLLINSYTEKRLLIENLGIALYIEQRFDPGFSKLTKEEFAKDFLFRRLNCKMVVIGEGYRFGHNKEGSVDYLKEAGAAFGAKVIAIPPVNQLNERVSSTRIRKLISRRDFTQVNALLGAPYFIIGRVQQGKKLGRKLGFPTINLKADPIKLLPPDGVYFTKTTYNGHIFEGITNVGANPTVGGTAKTIENYIFNFNETIYGKSVEVAFYGFCRNEVKFDCVHDLKQQVTLDIEKGKAFFAELFAGV